MSDHSANKMECQSKTSVEKKLLFMLLVIAVIPIGILIATLATGMFRFEAIIATVVTQICGLVLGYFFVSGVVRQSESINQALAKINSGDFEARAESITSDELGQSAIALNAMCDNTLNLIQSNDERDRIQTSIETLISEMTAIAAGDLTITTEVNEDMTGPIAKSVNHMTEQLRSIVRQVQSAAEQVTNSAGRIRESSIAISSDNDNQANCINGASEHLLEMTSSFQNVAAMTKESVEVAVEARQTASKGLEAVSNTVDGMQRIRDHVQSTSKRIKRLGESSQEIGEIVQLISDIADRTSILALNASIQAAMAGDAGQGFAVVAEEIECLAERSTDATKQISKLIRAIQNETSEVIVDMEESTREVVAGSQLAAQAGETLFEIDSVSNQLVELIQASSKSALQQADTAAGIASSMAEISLLTKDSADKSREATRSVGRLAGMVNQLRGSVSQFKIAETSAKFDLGQLLVESEPVGMETPVVAEKPSAPSGSKLKKAPKATLSNTPNSMEKAVLARKLREAKGLNERGNIGPVKNSKPATSTNANPSRTIPTQTKPTCDDTASETNESRGRKLVPTTHSADPENRTASEGKQSSPQTMVLGGQATAENTSDQVNQNPTRPAERPGISPTMMIEEQKVSARSNPETEYENDESLLRELRDANALQNDETKNASDGNEAVPREQTRTIMLDNN